MGDSERRVVAAPSSLRVGQREQYMRIQSFLLDEPDAKLPFSQRLAQENRWSSEYAEQVISEYKKFVFLAVNAGHPVTPSKAVDRAWHLHLTYTKSYWQEFCPQVLQTSLHHEPTQGGADEEEKFGDWYSKTLESYQHFFEETPPADIWPHLDKVKGGEHSTNNVEVNSFLLDSSKQMGLVVSLAILLSLMLGGYYLGRSQLDVEVIEALPILLLGLVVGFGALQLLTGIFQFLRYPSRPLGRGGCSAGGAAGCGVAAGHDFGGGDSGSCGGGSGGGCSGGCGGGCGGGGCGGG